MKLSNDIQRKLQSDNTTMQFELAEMRRMLAEKDNELEKPKGNDGNHINSGESDEALEELAAVKEELMQKEVEVKDMADLLEEAREEFDVNMEEKAELEKRLNEKEDEITKQRGQFLDFETRLEENQVLLQEANDRLEEKDAKIDNLEEAMENIQNIESVDELKEKVEILEATLEAERKCTNLELEMEKVQTSLVMKELDDKIHELTQMEEILKLERTTTADQLSEAAEIAAKEKERLVEEK